MDLSCDHKEGLNVSLISGLRFCADDKSRVNQSSGHHVSLLVPLKVLKFLLYYQPLCVKVMCVT